MTRMFALAVLASLAPAAPAFAAFPYQPQGPPSDYSSYRLPADKPVPNDLTDKRVWMYASTADPGSPYQEDKRELNGIRGAHIVDADRSAEQAWTTTTGRPDVTIAILDSGIKWNDDGIMADTRKKIRLNKGELPVPNATRTAALEPGANCASYTGDGYDRDRNGVFNVLDYACDDRVELGAAHNVNPDLLEPQDVLIAFSDGKDDDHNGYVDDIAGWDFLDDDNDPYDDVQYGHGSGEARDSAGEADNGGDVGPCPNCTEIPLRVGTSFIADVNRFALATLYAVDNGVSVVQEALGTLNKSALGRRATDYAWDHGVTIIASAADEAAQHNNWPSSYPHVILVNSVTHTDDVENVPVGKVSSYLQFNGCTNFNAKVDLAIPSVSCSSDATGRAAGMAGLVYSAARNAGVRLSAGEVKQLMASGSIGGVPQADDVDFAQDPFSGTSTELECPAPGCTDPFLAAPTTRQLPGLESYPARRGHDQFYGYGRVDMVNALKGVTTPPPDVEVTSPEWFAQVDPAKDFAVDGHVWARGAEYSCKVFAAPGGYPGVNDFYELPSPVCDGTARREPIDGRVALVDVEALKAKFPAGQPGDFSGREQGSAPEQAHSGRPNTLPYGFVVKIVATRGDRVGTDQRQLFLHRDRDALDARVPSQLPGDGEASPLLADLDGDNRNELIIANSDGVVHAYRRDGSELDGFPVHGDPLPMHPGSPAVRGGAVSADTASAFLASPAVGDLDHDGVPELVAVDMEGKVYVWEPDGRRVRRLESEVRYSGRPLHPFENVRNGVLNRTQLGFIGSPVLADIDGNDGGRLEIVAAAMDRHVYAWNDDGTPVPGFPVLVVDRSKVQSVDPETHKVTFKPEVPGDDITYDQGAIVDTPAVGDIDGDGKPEIVVGTNENYSANTGGEGALNLGANSPSYQALGQALAAANGRMYAIRATGDPDGDLMAGPAPWLDGWPFRVAILEQGVLPLVGEGITGAPAIGEVPCGGTDKKVVVGTLPAAGAAYLIGGDGQSCYGRDGGNDRALTTDTTGGAQDSPFIAAFGLPAFGDLAGGTAFLAPVAGVKRALDVVLPEYQRGGQDYLAGWETGTGTLRPGWPRPVNDLQFLTGPSVGDIDPSSPGEEVVSGSASDDLQGFTSAGTDVDGWPKLTGDWTVANPVIGSWGTLDTSEEAHKVVVALTRAGHILPFSTSAPACAPASWPRFHHDDANSGDARRDAVAPGTPMDAAVAGGELSFVSPGDDLMCGTAKGYEVRTGDHRITPETFAGATPVPGTFAPVEGGERATLDLGAAKLGRFVAVRAVDEQGNVGRPAVVETKRDAPPPPKTAGDGGATSSDGPGQDGGSASLRSNRAASGASRSARGRCAPAHARLTPAGLSHWRLGATARSLARAVGRPARTTGRMSSWCVAGGGTVRATFDARGRVVAVATTARGPHAGRIHPGLPATILRRLAPRRVALGHGVYVLSPRSHITFAVRGGRVQSVGVGRRL